MKKSKTIMGMLVNVEIIDSNVNEKIFDEVFDYLISVDKRFSTYKKDSEITLYNEGRISKENLSSEMKKVFSLSKEIKDKTNGFFDIEHNGKIDPSGLVKGLAIYNASGILRKRGFKNFYLEIAGDMEVSGVNGEGKEWVIGIRNPFNKEENVKILHLSDRGIATSGLYERGNHIYNPKENKMATDIASLTVVGSNVYLADCYATACFAMGRKGIHFIEQLSGFEGYMIDNDGVATFTNGFDQYVK